MGKYLPDTLENRLDFSIAVVNFCQGMGWNRSARRVGEWVTIKAKFKGERSGIAYHLAYASSIPDKTELYLLSLKLSRQWVVVVELDYERYLEPETDPTGGDPVVQTPHPGDGG